MKDPGRPSSSAVDLVRYATDPNVYFPDGVVFNVSRQAKKAIVSPFMPVALSLSGCDQLSCRRRFALSVNMGFAVPGVCVFQDARNLASVVRFSK